MHGLMLGMALAAAEEAPPPFGAEVSAGYALGGLFGEWTDPGPAGGPWVAVGLFPARPAGMQVGASLWARAAAWPVQTATETVDGETSTFPVRPVAYGVDVALRSDPDATWSGGVDFGFGRVDLADYGGGPLALPLFSVRAQGRRALGPVWAELGARGGFATQRGFSGTWEDWFVGDATLGVGVRLR